MWIEFNGGNAWLRPDGATVVRVSAVQTSQGSAEWAVQNAAGSFLDTDGGPAKRTAIIFVEAARAMDWLDRVSPCEFTFANGKFQKAA